MSNAIFSLNDVIKVAGLKGIIKDVIVDEENNTRYGIELLEGNPEITKFTLLYCLGKDLSLA